MARGSARPIREDWHEASDRFDLLSSELKDTFREFYEFQLRITKLFDKAGVKMIAGSDGGVWEVPGFSLHQEFDELARAGLSPLRVLQMTTLDAAEFLGRSKTLGAVDKGKVADLVLLNGNPMETVKNLHDISGVVRQGHYFSRADLDQLKDNVAVMRSASAASGTACC
jgi:imidazolonepropionase-like amidohydrolase